MTAATTQHVYVPGLGGWCLCCGSRSSDPRHVPARSAAANEPDYGTIDVPATPTTDEEIAKLPVFDLDTHTASAARGYFHRRFAGGYWRVDAAYVLKRFATRLENLAWRIEKPWTERVMADYFEERHGS